MHAAARAIVGLLLFSAPRFAVAQAGPAAPKTLVALLAHADDEAPVAPILARYAREGARVYMIIASDGSQGAGHSRVRDAARSGLAHGANAFCRDVHGRYPSGNAAACGSDSARRA